ncbi:MAG: hypothetical protein CR967_00530 [Proteobacteria bacterium]|nr:MAG: hypothetical protein CR967_00530 [Pseudomonadota bacterium]
MKKIKYLSIVLSGVLFLAGCGGSGDDSMPNKGTTTKPQTPKSMNVSGYVVDAPIVGATVCWDENNNDKCDANEKYRDVTDKSGAYDFDMPIRSVAKIISIGGKGFEGVVLRTNISYFKNLTKQPNGDFKLVNLTPLTNLVYTLVKSHGLSVADAIKLVERKIGVSNANSIDKPDWSKLEGLHKYSKEKAGGYGEVAKEMLEEKKPPTNDTNKTKLPTGDKTVVVDNGSNDNTTTGGEEETTDTTLVKVDVTPNDANAIMKTGVEADISDYKAYIIYDKEGYSDTSYQKFIFKDKGSLDLKANDYKVEILENDNNYTIVDNGASLEIAQDENATSGEIKVKVSGTYGSNNRQFEGVYTLKIKGKASNPDNGGSSEVTKVDVTPNDANAIMKTGASHDITGYKAYIIYDKEGYLDTSFQYYIFKEKGSLDLKANDYKVEVIENNNNYTITDGGASLEVSQDANAKDGEIKVKVSGTYDGGKKFEGVYTLKIKGSSDTTPPAEDLELTKDTLEVKFKGGAENNPYGAPKLVIMYPHINDKDKGFEGTVQNGNNVYPFIKLADEYHDEYGKFAENVSFKIKDGSNNYTLSKFAGYWQIQSNDMEIEEETLTIEVMIGGEVKGEFKIKIVDDGSSSGSNNIDFEIEKKIGSTEVPFDKFTNNGIIIDKDQWTQPGELSHGVLDPFKSVDGNVSDLEISIVETNPAGKEGFYDLAKENIQGKDKWVLKKSATWESLDESIIVTFKVKSGSKEKTFKVLFKKDPNLVTQNPNLTNEFKLVSDPIKVPLDEFADTAFISIANSYTESFIGKFVGGSSAMFPFSDINESLDNYGKPKFLTFTLDDEDYEIVYDENAKTTSIAVKSGKTKVKKDVVINVKSKLGVTEGNFTVSFIDALSEVAPVVKTDEQSVDLSDSSFIKYGIEINATGLGSINSSEHNNTAYIFSTLGDVDADSVEVEILDSGDGAYNLALGGSGNPALTGPQALFGKKIEIKGEVSSGATAPGHIKKGTIKLKVTGTYGASDTAFEGVYTLKITDRVNEPKPIEIVDFDRTTSGSDALYADATGFVIPRDKIIKVEPAGTTYSVSNVISKVSSISDDVFGVAKEGDDLKISFSNLAENTDAEPFYELEITAKATVNGEEVQSKAKVKFKIEEQDVTFVMKDVTIADAVYPSKGTIDVPNSDLFTAVEPKYKGDYNCTEADPKNTDGFVVTDTFSGVDIKFPDNFSVTSETTYEIKIKCEYKRYDSASEGPKEAKGDKDATVTFKVTPPKAPKIITPFDVNITDKNTEDFYPTKSDAENSTNAEKPLFIIVDSKAYYDGKEVLDVIDEPYGAEDYIYELVAGEGVNASNYELKQMWESEYTQKWVITGSNPQNGDQLVLVAKVANGTLTSENIVINIKDPNATSGASFISTGDTLSATQGWAKYGIVVKTDQTGTTSGDKAYVFSDVSNINTSTVNWSLHPDSQANFGVYSGQIKGHNGHSLTDGDVIKIKVTGELNDGTTFDEVYVLNITA